MSKIFRKSYTLPIPDGAELVTVKGVPSARFKHKGKTLTAPLTKGKDRVRVLSPSYYGTVNGKPVKLFSDAVASHQRLAELIRAAERNKTDLADPFDEHRRRPLAVHLADWRKSLSRNAGETHVAHCVNNVRRIIEACKFQTIRDLSASRVEEFLTDMQRDRPISLDATKTSYTKAELAGALGINVAALTPLLRRHRLEGIGNGKARRYPKATAERLAALRGRGHSIKTSNLYLDAIKTFCRWLVKDRRMRESPVEHLTGGNVRLDRRHDRRILDEGELRHVISAARESDVVFRGLFGFDREMLYAIACATGFRASELASLTPSDFDLGGDPPKATLSAVHAKNGRTAEQPLADELAASLRAYLAGRPANAIIWPGTWPNKAADMLRIDLDKAGIPYMIEGADGPLFCDFHSLRHSFIAMLDKAGATLKEAMQLARHSDPKLTMAVYGRARLHDLAGAVGKLPSLLKPTTPSEVLPTTLAATGTDGGRLPFPCRAREEKSESMMTYDAGKANQIESDRRMQVIELIEDEDNCGSVIKIEKSSPTRTRT